MSHCDIVRVRMSSLDGCHRQLLLLLTHSIPVSQNHRSMILNIGIGGEFKPPIEGNGREVEGKSLRG